MAEPNHSAIARVTVIGHVTEFSLPAGRSPGYLVSGPDGNIWFTESGTGAVGRITLAGTITEFPVPSGSADAITVGPDGALWFTERNGVGRITIDGVVTEYTGAHPHSLTRGADGALWFTEAVTPLGQPAPHEEVGRITTTGTVQHFTLPHPPMFAGGIIAGPDGNLWLGEQGVLVRMSTQGTVTEIPLRGVNSQNTLPDMMIWGRDGNLWMPGGSPPSLLRLNTSGALQAVTVTGMGSGPEPHIFDVGLGPDGHVWALGGFGIQAPSGLPDQLIRVS